MNITLQYFDDCPNWQTTGHHLDQLIAEGLDLTVSYERIDSEEKAVEKQFHGSPTVLVDGVDLFAEEFTPVALACRMYRTDRGLAGSPTLDQLRDVISAATS